MWWRQKLGFWWSVSEPLYRGPLTTKRSCLGQADACLPSRAPTLEGATPPRSGKKSTVLAAALEDVMLHPALGDEDGRDHGELAEAARSLPSDGYLVHLHGSQLAVIRRLS